MAPKYETHEKLLHFLDTMDEESSGAPGDLNNRMKENLDIFRGKSWKGNSAPYFFNNIIGTAIEEKTSKLSETKPRMKVLPYRNGLDKPAEVLSKVIDSIWAKQKVEYKTERIAMYAALSGVAVVGTPWNPYLQNGVGDIAVVVKDPRSAFMDLAITQAEDSDIGEYVIAEDFIPLDIIKKQYPGRGDGVEPDERVSGYADSGRPSSTREMIRAARNRFFGKNKDGADRKTRVIPSAILREYYVKDRRASLDDEGVVPMVKGLTQSASSGQPFPGGRRILRAGDIILKDEFNPYWDGNPPLDFMSWKIDLETAWAADEVQNVKRMAEAYNRIGDAYTKTAIVNGVVRLIMDSGALSPEERNKLSNDIGEIIIKNPGREFNYMLPQILPPELVAFIEKIDEWVRRRIGVSEAPTQKQVPSIITGPAIEGLQLMIETPIRTAARRVEELFQRIGQKLVSRVFQYYLSDRIIHLVGPEEQWMSFEFERRKILLKPDGSERSEEDIRKAFNDFYFAIEPGSSLAITKTQRVAAKFAFAQAGWLHPRDVLMEAGVLNADEKLKEAAKAKGEGLFDVIAGGKGGGGSPLGGANGLVQ